MRGAPVRNFGWFAVCVAATGISGQAVPRAAASRDRAITFLNAQPVLGMPLEGTRQFGVCSSDGTTYFDASDTTGTTRVLDLYSVSTSGEVRRLQRRVPLEFSNVFKKDFFPAESSLVTLIEAQKRDDRDGRPRETQYYLAVSGHDGDGSQALALDLKFKPLKVAQFGSGEYLVLGWEEANELEELAVLKTDGTVRRFIDLDQPQAGPAPAARVRETLDSLAGAAFVPFGSQVLLTFPGTVKPIWVVSDTGSRGAIQLEFPAGYLLHDVLSGSDYRTTVARVQERVEAESSGQDEAAPPRQRVFEFVTQTGKRLREFTFDNVPVSAVTCAAKNSLGAVFEQPVGDSDGKAWLDGAKQLVVATVRR